MLHTFFNTHWCDYAHSTPSVGVGEITKTINGVGGVAGPQLAYEYKLSRSRSSQFANVAAPRSISRGAEILTRDLEQAHQNTS